MKKKQQFLELWKACFEDTEEFIRFYFDQKYQDENTLVYEDNGEAVAALQMIPYPMTWANTVINTSYISGACTLPIARNKGVMKKLLAEAFRQMQQKDIAISVLIPAEPWLYEYYQKMGYATVFKYSIETFDTTATPITPDVYISFPDNCNQELLEKCYPYFSRHMSERPCCIQHPPEDFTGIVQDLYMSGGRLVTIESKDSGEITGMAMALPVEDKVWISELFYDSASLREALLLSVEKYWKNKPIVCRIPPRGTNTICAGMARIINAAQMLALYAAHYPERSFSLQLTDPQLPENNGFYILSNGICKKTEKADRHFDFKMDAATLVQALFGQHTETTTFPQQHPYMSLMFD